MGRGGGGLCGEWVNASDFGIIEYCVPLAQGGESGRGRCSGTGGQMGAEIALP